MKILYQMDLKEQHIPQTKNEGTVFAKKSLKRNHYQEISEKLSTKESLKRHSLPKDWKEESLPKIF